MFANICQTREYVCETYSLRTTTCWRYLHIGCEEMFAHNYRENMLTKFIYGARGHTCETHISSTKQIFGFMPNARACLLDLYINRARGHVGEIRPHSARIYCLFIRARRHTSEIYKLSARTCYETYVSSARACLLVIYD